MSKSTAPSIGSGTEFTTHEVVGREFRGLAISPSGQLAWTLAVPSGGGEIVLGDKAVPLVTTGRPGVTAWLSDTVLVTALAGSRPTTFGKAPVDLRGEPGAALVAVEATSQAVRYSLSLGSTEWTIVSALHPLADGGALAVGSFSGTLRAGAHVVSSAGVSDGFVVRVSPAGSAMWLIRLGGDSADAVTAVDASRELIAIAGSFSQTADLRGVQLQAREPRSPYPDAFAAVLSLEDGRVRWAEDFGGLVDDSAVGVVLRADNVVVAANARDRVVIGSQELTLRGSMGVAVVSFSLVSGAVQSVRTIDGPGQVRATSLSASGTTLLLGASFTERIAAGPLDLVADNTDGVMFLMSEDLTIRDANVVTGPGRNDVSAVQIRGGATAIAISHSAAASFMGRDLPASVDGIDGLTFVSWPSP